jgi:hypothetical protein
MARDRVPRTAQPGVAPPPALEPCKKLEEMRANPKADWTINDVETLCGQIGLTLKPPRGGGSHYKALSDKLDGMLMIPARRPIKPVYIRNLVSLADAHRRAAAVTGGKR